MKYLKHVITGEVYAYAADGSEDAFIDQNLRPMSDGEVQAHLNPPPIAAPVPQVVSAFQARAALLRASMLDSVEAIMADPDTPREAALAWEYATEFRRDSATVAAISQQLGITESALDALFIDASGISA